MKKALIIALGACAALVASGLSIAQTNSNPFQSTVVSAQTQDVAQKQKHKHKKHKKSKSKHHKNSHKKH